MIFAATSYMIGAADMSMATLVPRLFLSMLVVIAVMWFAARVMKNRQIPGSGIVRASTSHREAPKMQVIAKTGLGKNASIAIVRVGDRELVVGITEQHVSLISHMDSNPPLDLSESHRTGTPGADLDEDQLSSARKGLLEQVREMTVRKV